MDLEVGMVILTGGEPMLRKDIYDIVKLFSEKNIDVRIQTNGTLLTKEKILKLNEAKLSGITISLDTLYETNMNQITGSKTFKKIIEGIVNTKKYSKFEAVSLNTVITKNNLFELPSIVKFVTDLNMFVSLIPLHHKKHTLFSKDSSQDHSNFLCKKDLKNLKRIMDKLIVMRKHKYNIINSDEHLKGIFNFIKTGNYHWNCDSPSLYFTMRPDGTFCPCLEYKTKYKMNSLDFVKIYKSQKFKSEIKKIVDSCNGCFYLCWLETSALVKHPLRFVGRALQLYKTNTNKNIDYKSIVKKYVHINK